MAKRTIDERIDQLEARKKALQARRSRQHRAKDTRRKVLLGALVLHRIENDPENGEQIRRWVAQQLPRFLTRATDMLLFEEFLPPQPAHPMNDH